MDPGSVFWVILILSGEARQPRGPLEPGGVCGTTLALLLSTLHRGPWWGAATMKNASTLAGAVGALVLVGGLWLPSGCAGPAAREQAVQVEHLQAQLVHTLEELDAATSALPGETSEERIAALQDQFRAVSAALREAVQDLPAAWQEDLETWQDTAGGKAEDLIGGVLSMGGAQGGLIGIGSTILLSLWRDRRKKLGGDPLQLVSTKTPPTNEGPA